MIESGPVQRSVFVVATAFLAGVGALKLYNITHPAVMVPWLAMTNKPATEYCPIPLVDSEKYAPPPCTISSDMSSHIRCDCSRVRPSARPEFEKLLAYSRAHPLPGMKVIAPILPER